MFPEFDPAVHVIDTLPADIESWDFYLGIDYGHSAPLVACWFAYNPATDVIISMQEWRYTETLIEDHITAIKMYSGVRRIVLRVSDHDSQMNHQLEAGSLPTEPADKGPGSILRGLDLIRLRLRDRRLLLYKHQLIERDPILEERQAVRDGIEEMQGYRHKPIEKHVGDSTKDDIPIKGDDHWIDVCRYVLDKIDTSVTLEIPTTVVTPDVSAWERF